MAIALADDGTAADRLGTNDLATANKADKKERHADRI
jgi:hypothetical protein